MADSPIRKASDLLSAILPAESMDKTNMWSDFFMSWKAIAGDRFSAHAKPVDVRNGIVIIETEHPGWIQLMQFEQNKILAKLQNNFPELKLKGIAFKLKNDFPNFGSSAKKTAEERDKESSEDAHDSLPQRDEEKQAESVQEVLERIADPGFRSLMDSVASSLREANKKKPGRK